MLKEVDELIMKVWKDERLTMDLKNEIVKRLQEVQMLLQEGDLCIGQNGKRLL